MYLYPIWHLRIELWSKLVVSVCKEIQVDLIDSRNIRRFNLFKDGSHLLNSEERLLVNNFVDNFNDFYPWCTNQAYFLNRELYTYNDDINEVGNLDVPCNTPLILMNLKLKNKNRLVLEHLNIIL